MTIQALAAELGIKAALMEKGQLNTEQIDALTDLAKELYERMVVLRYKAFEAMVHPAPEPKEANEPAPIENVKPLQQESAPEPAKKIALKFGQPEVAHQQISLIDSIEEIQKEEEQVAKGQKKSAAPASDEDTPSLAQKLKKAPLPNLKTGIGINQRFLFITTLFLNDKEAYQSAIDQLNSFGSFPEADEFIQNVLKTRYDWQMKNPVVKELLELVERRYLSF